MTWLIAVVAVLGGGGGIAGIVTAFVAVKGAGTTREDSRYRQLNDLVSQYKAMVDEYRQEAARDEAKIVQLEQENDRCLSRVTVLANRLRVLEARVAELGG